MKNLLLPLLLGALAGCVSYQPHPLGTRSTLGTDVAHISIDRSLMPLPELATHEFSAGGGLGMTDIAMLAVVNNPDLKVARADARIAHAQAFNAGLLPDPQFHFGLDFPYGAVGAVTAFNMSLSEDVLALIQHSANRKAADEDARKTDLNLLWQEWQVVARARTLFVRVTQNERLMEILVRNRAVFADRYDRTQAALDRGLMTIDAVTPQLTALQDVDRQIRDLERQNNTDKHDLNALLGLAPEVLVPLNGTLMVPPLDPESVLSLLPDLPRRRPDLIALQYGYNAGDQRYRVAILGQFPAMSVGFNHARDTTPIYMAGFGVTLTLPIFNGNRGNIAIGEATREMLHEDYQNRLNTANGDVRRILDEHRVNARQLDAIGRELADLSRAANKADLAFRSRHIDALAFANIQTSLLAKQVEQLNLEQAILLQRVALQSLIGGELPIAYVVGGVDP
jgi:outer membrane protein TolC